MAWKIIQSALIWSALRKLEQECYFWTKQIGLAANFCEPLFIAYHYDGRSIIISEKTTHVYVMHATLNYNIVYK